MHKSITARRGAALQTTFTAVDAAELNRKSHFIARSERTQNDEPTIGERKRGFQLTFWQFAVGLNDFRAGRLNFISLFNYHFISVLLILI